MEIVGARLTLKKKIKIIKSHIRETLTLSTDADSRNKTIKIKYYDAFFHIKHFLKTFIFFVVAIFGLLTF